MKEMPYAADFQDFLLIPQSFELMFLKKLFQRLVVMLIYTDKSGTGIASAAESQVAVAPGLGEVGPRDGC